MAERVIFKPPWSPAIEPVADGVWLLRGDLKQTMNIYLLRDEDGVTAFDAGTRPMVRALRKAAERLGGLKRIVLGHSHTDHRGTAPFMDVPVYCHLDEVRYAESDEWPDYWDIDKISVGSSRFLYKHFLHRRWDGGGVKLAGALKEGEEVCGFTVIHFPGHAPGQIGLWRESDRLAITSDTVYFVDSERAKASVRKLAALEPATVCPGHEHPYSVPDLSTQLLRAAEQA